MESFEFLGLAIRIGLLVVQFLLNTSRVLKAIELCKECLILINACAPFMTQKTVKFCHSSVYWLMFESCIVIKDNSSAIKWGRKLLVLLREPGDRDLERYVTMHLAILCESQCKYTEATELYTKVLSIMKTGQRELEQVCYERLGILFSSIGEYARAEEFLQQALQKSKEIGRKKGEAVAYGSLGTVFQYLGKYVNAEEHYLKGLRIMREINDKHGEASCYGNLGTLFQSRGEYDKAEEILERALKIRKAIGDKRGEAADLVNLGAVFLSRGEYVKAEEHYCKGLRIKKEINDKHGEASCYGNLGTLFMSRGEYDKAEEILERALKIRKSIDDKRGEATDLGNLGNVFLSRGEYVKAEEYLQEALQITKEIGNKTGEASFYGTLGTVFYSLGEYVKAKEFHQKALDISTEIGDKQGTATSHGNLGTVFDSLSEYIRAKEYHQKALAIHKEIGDKKGEASSYSNLGTVFKQLGEFAKAEKYLQKALGIEKAIGNKEGEAFCYGNLGTVFQSKGEFIKAEEHYLKALQIRKEIGDKRGEACHYGSLGTVSHSLGKYAKAEECLEKSLANTTEIGDKKGQADAYENLGVLFLSVGEFVRAEEYVQKGLQIKKEIGDKRGEASCYGNLGLVLNALGENDKAKNFHQKALQISIEIGDQHGIAREYGHQGVLLCELGEYDKAEENLRKSLQITKKIGDQTGDAYFYGKLGFVFGCIGEYSKATKFHEKALELSYKIGHIELQFRSHLYLTLDSFHWKGSVDEAVSNLVESIKKSEKLRGFLRDNDHFKISFLDVHLSPYKLLSLLFCMTGKHYEALYVVELGRARALADLMSVRFCVEIQISVDQESWVGIGKIVKESGCVCLYISYFGRLLFLWVIKRNKVSLFRQMDINDSFGDKERERNVDEVFGDVTFRKFHHLSQGQYEDRSLSTSNISHLTCESSHECSQEDSLSIGTEDDDEDQFHQPPSLSECYKMIIAPVADLLDEPEIIIVPDRILYKVPFAAFKDESGKYLSESFRLRIVPSLTTLKLIQDSPAEYHSQTGALIVGDPQVGHVTYKGGLKTMWPLPCARKEAEMIGRLLGVQPLLGEHATKQAVLKSIHSVSLIHFAAHGDAQRGEIVLAPPRHFSGFPQEQDYLLSMAEISQVRLTAKLVVLSCCHSADGQIRSEGVVGIARAFLGSGARSVLVALWAIQDEATEQFMSRFYEHLVGGESASESLHQAMKWMRANGFSDVEQWAPFMLIGDDVTFDFRK